MNSQLRFLLLVTTFAFVVVVAVGAAFPGGTENEARESAEHNGGDDAWVREEQTDGKKDSIFGNVYDMFRKSSFYQSFYNGQYMDLNSLEKRLASIK